MGMLRTLVVIVPPFLALLLAHRDARAAVTVPDNGSGNCGTSDGCFKITNTNGTPTAPAILGVGSFGYGVQGSSPNGTGVIGVSNNVGVEGVSAGWGVYGVGSSASSIGVRGYSTAGVAIQGVSLDNDGLNGVTHHAGRSGLFAQNLASGGGGYGVYALASGSGQAVRGENTNSSGWAGYFNGKVFAASGYTSSDARLKKDVAELAYGLKDLASLRAVSFKWKDQSRGDGRHLGFLAQDLQKIVPEVVDKDAKSGMLSVNYPALVPVLVKAVQEQQAIIQRQEARLASLEQRPIISSMLSGGTNVTVALGAVGALAFALIRRRREQRQDGGPRTQT